ELLTPRFVVWCSIQLSYGRIVPDGRSGRKPGVAKGYVPYWQEQASGVRPWLSSGRSGAGPLAPPRAEFDRLIGNRDPERRPDGAVDQADVATMRAYQLGCDRKPEPRSAGASGALERFEQMLARL